MKALFVTKLSNIRYICAMKKMIIMLSILIMIAGASSNIWAHGGNSGKKDKAKFELKIENKIEDENEVEIEAGIENKVEINGQRFEIRGEISSISGNTFVVLGQTINIDPSKVEEFEQKGILQVGKTVKVEGIIENDTKFAREIMVIGTGQGRFRLEIEGEEASITPTPTGILSLITPTVTPSAALSPNTRVEIKAKGPINEVLDFLKQVMAFLQNLI